MPLLRLLYASLATAHLQFPANSTERTAEARQKTTTTKKAIRRPGVPRFSLSAGLASSVIASLPQRALRQTL